MSLYIQLLKGIHVNMRIFVQVHHKFVSNIYLHAICLLIDMFPLPLAVGFPTSVEKCLKTTKKTQKLMLLAVFFFRFLKQAFSGSMLVCPGIILTDQNRSWMLVNGIGILPLLGTNCWEACRCGVSHANIDIHNMFICIGNTHKKSTHISIYLHPTVCSSPSLICTELYNYMQIKKTLIHTYPLAELDPNNIPQYSNGDVWRSQSVCFSCVISPGGNL